MTQGGNIIGLDSVDLKLKHADGRTSPLRADFMHFGREHKT
jgi:hypothetical protein